MTNSSSTAESLTLAQWVAKQSWDELPELLSRQLAHLLSGGGEVEDLQVINWLSDAGWFDGLDELPSSLLLFVKGFCVRRAWFALQPTLLEQGWSLEVGLIRVTLHRVTDAHQSLPSENSALAAIYDDLDYLANMTPEGVDAQIRAFWQKYEAYVSGGEAYVRLGAEPSDSWPTIVAKYRALASKHHPDKGGDAKRFQEVQQAFDQLKALRKR